MEVSFSVDMHDADGYRYENGVLLHIGPNTILHFANSNELRDFANDILLMLSEIRAAEDSRSQR